MGAGKKSRMCNRWRLKLFTLLLLPSHGLRMSTVRGLTLLRVGRGPTNGRDCLASLLIAVTIGPGLTVPLTSVADRFTGGLHSGLTLIRPIVFRLTPFNTPIPVFIDRRRRLRTKWDGTF